VVDDIAALAARVDAQFGRVDALINNAGWMPGRVPVLQTDAETIDRALGSNLVSGFWTTKHFAPPMIRNGGGRINLLATVVHRELADDGIRTVAIVPGLTDPAGMREIITEQHLAKVAGSYPGGRVGQPEDIVALTVFLCSDAAEHLSGSVITVRPPALG
jgi:NAD(P)-dependent dehydrogenase (short-subunit alcohol dehydrogenase family)